MFPKKDVNGCVHVCIHMCLCVCVCVTSQQVLRGLVLRGSGLQAGAGGGQKGGDEGRRLLQA